MRNAPKGKPKMARFTLIAGLQRKACCNTPKAAASLQRNTPMAARIPQFCGANDDPRHHRRARRVNHYHLDGLAMIRYSHYIIAWGKALAEALSQRRPFSVIDTRRTFNF